MPANVWAALLLTAAPAAAGPPAVVVNEVFYHAPNDLDRVQWVELHNTTDQPVAVGGWTLDKGKVLTVPAGTSIPARGFLVFALDADEFAKAYGDGVKLAGTLGRPLKRGGEKLELRDDRGAVVDVVRYGDDAPWPVSADGYSASLERICPDAPGDSPENWAGTPLPTTPRPAGTPGRANAAYAAAPPPVVSAVTQAATVPPDRPFPVSAKASGEVREVTLLYRVVTPERVGAEASVPMAKGADGAWAASIPEQPAGVLLRYRVRAIGADGTKRLFPAEHDLRPTLSAYVHDPFGPTPLARAVLIRGRADRQPPGDAPRPPRGSSAFVHADPKTGAVELFDYVHAAPRNRRPGDGAILHFHKDKPCRGMTAATLMYEGSDRWLLAEALSYDLYRRAGNAAPLAEFVRLTADGRPAGTYLLLERPNKSFLRRNGVDPGGNLYKVNWWGGGLEGTHERKSGTGPAHDDLKEMIDRLAKTRRKPDEQWKVIQKHVDVDQMATFFAVSDLLSNWDGYFNNHYIYHDTKRDRWQLYPWDHDQTWGDGMDGDRLLVDMPLFYGAEGVNPGGIGPGWWRPGGVFSTPLLANPHFKKVYLEKVRKLLAETFTEKVYHPVVDELVGRLADDAAADAKARGEDPAAARARWTDQAASFKTFVTKRRAWLLARPELKR
ncbi:MAG: CotH kinase family protein [Gemmataceae bacterium]|nr:CotH kinase family protein [Gemmataceae bacterium]